jgi:NTE family protein
MSSKVKPVTLALQGGGTHSAFSWGVIDRLLSDEGVAIEAISATSGGAMLACITAYGLNEGGREHAQELLHSFWKKVSLAARMMPMHVNIADKMLGHVSLDMSASSMALDYITKIFSPYQFNLFDVNPLRDIMDEVVDFDVLNGMEGPQLYINTTHAKTGESRLFTQGELSRDVVMASACLPFIFKTVEINGEPYWDGSFSGCPRLSPLVNNCESSDLLLVQIHPSQVDEIPTTAADILDRTTEMTFNSILSEEIKRIELFNKMIEIGNIDRRVIRIHKFEASDVLANLGRASKLNADWDFLMHLHDLGVQVAEDWLKKGKA